MSDEGRLVAGRYRIIQRIGTGAMGAVWQAQDEVLHRKVAIKQLLLSAGLDMDQAEDAKQRTMREGRIAARLHHPNAISVFDVVTDSNGHPCLIMEYLESTSLAAVLQEHRTLPPIEVARIGAQVAAALKEAHAVGIVHRDIKPGNILLSANGTVKITDFGISRAKDDVTVTKTGMIAGTPAYLAPEVAIGGDPGPEADVFSLGSTLYAATEGQPPFGLSENTLSLLHAVAAGQINPPRQSGTLASVLAVLLHPETEHRPTAEESEELLAAVARGETPLGGPAEETRIGPGMGMAAGALGMGAANGTRSIAEEDLPAGHSGTLMGNGGATRGFPHQQEDGYAAASGYPEDDYDATRAVGPGRYNDGYDDAGRAMPAPARSAVDEDEKPGAWKKPALIGGIVLIGLVALGIWLFSPRGDDTNGDQPPQQPLPVPTTTSAPSSSSSAPSSSSEETTTEQQRPSEEEPTTTRRRPTREPAPSTDNPTREPSQTPTRSTSERPTSNNPPTNNPPSTPPSPRSDG